MLLETTLSSSDFSGVDLPLGNSIVDLEYADDVVLFDDADEMQSLDHFNEQCKHVWDTILSLQM